MKKSMSMTRTKNKSNIEGAFLYKSVLSYEKKLNYILSDFFQGLFTWISQMKYIIQTYSVMSITFRFNVLPQR